MKRKNRRFAKVRRPFACAMVIVILCSLFFSVVPQKTVYAEENGQMENPPEAPLHGTADEWIPWEAVNNTPPADYVVNQKTQGKAEKGDYSAFFLEDEIQTVQIEIEENNLNYLLQNAGEEPYVMATSVTVGDVALGYCGLRTKGSYTLEHSVTENAGSDRFSFTVNFGKYIKKKDYGVKQNFFGCDKISFNNFFFDKTMMKEFFALKLLDEMGLPTPEYGIAKIYINGEYYGVYAMVEAMDHSILERYYGVDKDELSSYLCKPEGTQFRYEEICEDPSPLWEQDEDTKKDVEDMLPTVTEWVRRLNLLADGKDFDGQPIQVNSEEYLQLLDQVMDTDEVVKYFAVHSWLCQVDNMFDGQKNFGLYVDSNGRALMVPWDYDLSFGCFYPSDAEHTANNPLDLMYRLNVWDLANEKAISAEFYKEFPLFYVIYQNEALMKQYYEYMKECSKVATLGGTIASTGKTYDPGYFYSYIDKMQEAVIAAATEELAENVYYMNGIRQPRDVKKGIPNLAKIIAMRSVGVVNQVDGVAAKVCTYGCDLSTLGNAVKGEAAKKGMLTSVDTATGIYVTANYPGGKNISAPVLTVETLEKNEVIFDMFCSELGCTAEEMLVVYKITNKGKPDGSLQLTLPMTQAMMQAEGEFSFYTHLGGALQEVTMKAEDNLYRGEVMATDYVVVVKRTGGKEVPSVDGTSAEKDNTEQNSGLLENENSTKVQNRVFGLDTAFLLPVVVLVSAVILALAVLIVIRKKKK